MKFYATLLILVLLQGVMSIGQSELSDKQLQDLVDKSTLTFIGTVKELDNSNVSGIDAKDFPIIVQVDSVESADPQVPKTFGELKGTKLTVALNPASRNVMQNNVPAVFFADPLIYEKNIGVVATAVPILDTKEGFLNKLHAAALQKSEAPLRTEVKSADLIISGEVEAIRPLPDHKAAGLRSVNKGWEVRSEHRPIWAEAVIKVQRRLKPVDKGVTPDFVLVVFPSTHDCFFAESPKFEVKESGIWLLYLTQLDQQERKVLLASDDYNAGKIQSYTALRPADFQPLTDAMLNKIQQMIETR